MPIPSDENEHGEPLRARSTMPDHADADALARYPRDERSVPLRRRPEPHHGPVPRPIRKGVSPMAIDGAHSELYEAGLRVRREVVGDEYVDRALAGATDSSRPL